MARCRSTRGGQVARQAGLLLTVLVGGSCESARDERAASEHPCKGAVRDVGRSPVYTEACAAYLEQCTRKSWFYRAGEELAGSFRASVIEDVFPNGVGNDSSTRATVIAGSKSVAAALQAFYDQGIVDEAHAKSLGVGFRSHTYVGLYNCGSRFQRWHLATGCPWFRVRRPFAKVDTYIGVMRNFDHDDSLCARVDQPHNAGSTDSSRTSTTPDCHASPEDLRNRDCAFEVWPRASSSNREPWAYYCTQAQPATSFDPASRPWYQEAADDFARGAEASVAIFRPPYKNYGTGEPIFGTVTPFVDATEKLAGVVLAIEYLEDEPTYQQYVPECDQRSSDFREDFTYSYDDP